MMKRADYSAFVRRKMEKAMAHWKEMGLYYRGCAVAAVHERAFKLADWYDEEAKKADEKYNDLKMLLEVGEAEIA